MEFEDLTIEDINLLMQYDQFINNNFLINRLKLLEMMQ
jgi:hypothetical protein